MLSKNLINGAVCMSGERKKSELICLASTLPFSPTKGGKLNVTLIVKVMIRDN